uniref:Uncharacterized protein n=1 Tax=Tetradesmus obliquus TaxID=3088 RepID=A0A383VTX2_TETOB|eukprot:jgi/Sobl393_1/3427/SZX68948.1
MESAACSLAALELADADNEEQQQQARVVAAMDICIQNHCTAEDVCRLRASSRALQQLISSRLSGAQLSSALLVRGVAAAAQAAAAAAPYDEFVLL